MAAGRMTTVAISGIRKMFDAAPPEAINLSVGEPDFQPPAHAVEAYKNALDAGKNTYGPSFGIPALRQALAEHVSPYKKDVSSDDVIVTAGGTQALMATMFALVNPGDDVLVPDPGFVLYAPHTTLCGGTPVPYTSDGDVVEAIAAAITPKTSAIVVNSPSNPTGAVLDAGTVKRITAIAEEHACTIISDEVYDRFVYGGAHASFLGRYENVVFVNSFSKTYAMTGWRLGYLVTSTELAEPIMKASYHMIACPTTPTEYAALAALTGPQDAYRTMYAAFKERRDFVVAALNAIDGMSCAMPRGAFYAFPRYENDVPAAELAQQLLKNGVVTTPGTAFGARGEHHLRISYAAGMDVLKRGIECIKETVERL